MTEAARIYHWQYEHKAGKNVSIQTYCLSSKLWEKVQHCSCEHMTLVNRSTITVCGLWLVFHSNRICMIIMTLIWIKKILGCDTMKYESKPNTVTACHQKATTYFCSLNVETVDETNVQNSKLVFIYRYLSATWFWKDQDRGGQRCWLPVVWEKLGLFYWSLVAGNGKKTRN